MSTARKKGAVSKRKDKNGKYSLSLRILIRRKKMCDCNALKHIVKRCSKFAPLWLKPTDLKARVDLETTGLSNKR